MIIFGHRLYGRILSVDNAYVATRFFHLWFIPLIPLGSTQVIATEGSQIRGFAVPFQWTSMLTAWVRAAAIAPALLSAIFLMESTLPSNEGPSPWLAALVAVALSLPLIALGWLVLGRVSDERRAQLRTYAMAFGHPVDVALLGEQRPRLRDAIVNDLQQRVGMWTSSYRTALDPTTQWATIALDPSMRDPWFLAMALTLSRIEHSLGDGAHASTHAQIWERIKTVVPVTQYPFAAPATRA